MKFIIVAGARPNFVKIAPIIWELDKRKKLNNKISYVLVHTGQHYDKNMSDAFFDDLSLPQPDYNLGVGGGTHSEQTAKIMLAFEPICLRESPDLIFVVGDVNSTIACTLVAKKLNIKVAHIESGLRSFDRTMPEEINRLLTDVISDYLFVSEKSGLENLKKEGISDNKIFFVGNIMIDTLIHLQPSLEHTKLLNQYNLIKNKFLILTLHRPSNVDSKHELQEMIEAITDIQNNLTIIWPMHPRTKANLLKYDLLKNLNLPNLYITEPLGYKNFMTLLHNCTFVLTDSGGIQEETTYLGIPCLTLRNNTERPSTITEGTNILIGQNWNKAKQEVKILLNQTTQKHHQIPKYWDGNTAERIFDIILKTI